MPRAASHWAVAGAGLVLVATAVVVGARDGFAFLDVVRQGSGHASESDALVVSLAGLGALAIFVWMRARAADRLAERRRDD